MLKASIAAGCVLIVVSCNPFSNSEINHKFTLAVIPDTQNYLDYLHQKNEGYPLNAVDMFKRQLQYIADHAVSRGGDIAFVTSVGDVWQHASKGIDDEHLALGHLACCEDRIPAALLPDARAISVEMPAAAEGYRLLKGVVPFAVAPGNHDYDGFWLSANHGPEPPHNPFGQVHYNGRDNFVSVFGAQSEFFKDADYYVDSFNGGANSATVFSAGGYQFLHISLEMQPADDVLAWAQAVMDARQGWPTILSMHEYLNTKAERKSVPYLNFKAVHDTHNDPEDLWQKLISPNDQVFLVLSGHFHGQARRIDQNAHGHAVYQLLSDYQDRRQVYLDAGGDPDKPYTALGDGWMRLMQFDFAQQPPRVTVRTFSTHYDTYANEHDNYAAHYRAHEQAEMDDAAFLEQDEFMLDLDDFTTRFGLPQN